MDNEQEEENLWELRCGGELVGTLTVTDQDFPWNYGRISVTPSFERLRHLFVVHQDMAAKRATQELIRQHELSLTPIGAGPVREFTLIVEGSEAKFRFI